MMHAIETQLLSKRFPGGYGVHDLDLVVPPASIVGSWGQTGAGRFQTTTFDCGPPAATPPNSGATSPRPLRSAGPRRGGVERYPLRDSRSKLRRKLRAAAV